MSHSLHAAYYADCATQQTVEIVENVRLARDTYRVRFLAPTIARRIVPGQFVMLRLAGMTDPLIGRPLALYDTTPLGTIDLVYLVKGKFTSRLCQLVPDQRLDVWGPLGNGFPGQGSKFTGEDGESATRNAHLILVAGGIGQTPFYALAQEALGLKTYGEPPRRVPRAERITFCYGARSADYFAGLEDFERLGIDLRLATDDGTRGHHGLVTDLVRQVLAESAQRPAAERPAAHARIACCGPEPMMQAVAQIAADANVPCEVSLETPMACGIGICFTCVAKIRQPDGAWDYKRTCVEGPVFAAENIVW
jgi:dihydroorotate dehydrogenase electron transfer subunit